MMSSVDGFTEQNELNEQLTSFDKITMLHTHKNNCSILHVLKQQESQLFVAFSNTYCNVKKFPKTNYLHHHEFFIPKFADDDTLCGLSW